MTSITAFIGSGNMARSLCSGLIENGHAPTSLIVSEPNQQAAQALATELGVRIANSNTEAVDAADVVILAVKPQVIGDVGGDYRKFTAAGAHLDDAIGARFGEGGDRRRDG